MLDADASLHMAKESETRLVVGTDEGEVQCAEGEVQCAEGEVQCAEGEVQCAEGEVQCAEGEVQCAEGEVQCAEGGDGDDDGIKKEDYEGMDGITETEVCFSLE